MTDVSNTQVIAKNLSFLELLSQPNVWRLLSIPFCAMITMGTWLAVATYLDVRTLNVDVATVKAEVTHMRSDINELNAKVEKLDGKMDIIIDLFNGNNINRSVPKDETTE